MTMLSKPADLDALLQENDPSSVEDVTFEADFGIRDEHIYKLVNAFGKDLVSLKLGSSDTGDGAWLSDSAVLRIVSRCPNLTQLELNACTKVTDAAFHAIIDGLPKLTTLACTGNDKISGSLKKKALDPLLKDSNKLPRLRKLYITDQAAGLYDVVQKLIKKRRGLRVQAGTSDSDSFAWGCVLGEMGCDYGDGLYGNMGGGRPGGPAKKRARKQR